MYHLYRGGIAVTDYKAFIRYRITELRMQKGISEYQMSLELGQNKNYIQGISSGKALPSMTQFLNICEFFDMTPMQFFDGDNLYPRLARKAFDDMCGLDTRDLQLILTLIQRLQDTSTETGGAQP